MFDDIIKKVIPIIINKDDHIICCVTCKFKDDICDTNDCWYSGDIMQYKDFVRFNYVCNYSKWKPIIK